VALFSTDYYKAGITDRYYLKILDLELTPNDMLFLRGENL
jgi:hypothetical protein